MEEQRKTAVYILANWIEEARTNIAENEKVYADSVEQINGRLKTYGGLPKLEDDSNRFASELRESEERLKNDLGGRSFFKKRMNIGKYWDAGLLEEFRDFEGVVGTGYARFIGDVYAKLDKNGDVLVSPRNSIGIGSGIILSSVYGAVGIMYGSLAGGVFESVVKMKRLEPGSDFVIAGAIVGGVGVAALGYDLIRGGVGTFKNLLSDGADDLEKRVGVIRDALVC